MKKKKEDTLFQQNGKFYITVYYGECIVKYLIKADTYGLAIQKIVNDMVKEYPEGYDFDSEIRFVREIFEELK